MNQPSFNARWSPLTGDNPAKRTWLRINAVTVALLAGVFFATGCSHYMESRTIAAFSRDLEAGDVDGLKSMTSRDFQESALRRDDAPDSIKQVGFPKGEAKIVKVETEGDSKKVMAEIGDLKRKVIYTLVRDGKSHKWVVDDVEIKKKLKHGQTHKTFTEQVDMLLSVRDILDQWEGGRREGVLETSTPELRAALEKLPTGCFDKLVSDAMSEMHTQKGLRPEIEGHEKSAVAKIPRPAGDILISLKNQEGSWKVDDMHVQLRRSGDHIPSLRKNAVVMGVVNNFLDSYRAENKSELEKICTGRLYDSCLKEAQLNRIKLPETAASEGDMEIVLHKPITSSSADKGTDRNIVQRSLVILKNDKELLNLSLVSQTSEGDKILHGDQADFRIDDVSLQDINGNQQKNLISMFQSQSLAEIYAQALTDKNFKVVRLASTQDFNQRVWKLLEDGIIEDVPLEGIGNGTPVIRETAYRGTLTEVSVEQGEQFYTFVIREANGKLMVDDILFPALDRPNSLKVTLELMLPVKYFAAAIQKGDMSVLRKNSSKDFNKLVWNHCETLPEFSDCNPLPHLSARLATLQQSPDRAIISLGDEKRGAKVWVQREGAHFVVDDIIIIRGAEQHARVDLKSQLRSQLSHLNTISKESPPIADDRAP